MKNLVQYYASFFSPRGFTLIELLIVIVIIGALAVSVFVALNPVKRLIDARDARRSIDVTTISKAIRSYEVDHTGFPPSMSGMTLNTDYQIGNAASGSCTQIHTGGCNISGTNCINLATDLAQYLKTIPTDPIGGANTAADTGYAVNLDASNSITVKACRTGIGTTEGIADISEPPLNWPDLIQNPSFESGTGPWFFSVQGTATGTYTVDNTTSAVGANSAKIVATTIDANSWDLQLVSNTISLVAGQTYQISFYAKRDASAHTILIYEQQHYSPYGTYYTKSYNLTTSWTQYTTTFVAPATDSNTVLNINVGSNTGTVWFDDIHLQ